MPRYIPYVPKKEEKRYIAAKPAEKGNYISFDFNRDAQDTSPNYENASAGQNSSPLPSKYVSWQGNTSYADEPARTVASPLYGMRPNIHISENATPQRVFTRGETYPEWYQGLIAYTHIEIVKVRDDADVRCKIHLGLPWDNHKQETKALKFKRIDSDPQYERASATFYSEDFSEELHHMNPAHKDIWPYRLDKDLFDNIAIIRVGDGSGKPLKIKKVKIWLNNTIICNHEFNPLQVVNDDYHLTRFIREQRFSNIDHSDDPVLQIVAGELGKSWHPCYGTTSSWLKFPGMGFVPNPGHWCDDFADWVIREAVLRGKVTFPHDEYGPFPGPDCCFLNENWFEPKGLLHHPSNTKWNQLGSLVKPGFLGCPYGHGAFFAFWVKPIENHSDYTHICDSSNEATVFENVMKIMDEEKPEVFEPYHFVPENDINWYCYIGGNTSRRVKRYIAPIIRLKYKNTQLLDFCEENHGKAMLWWDGDIIKQYNWDGEYEKNGPYFWRTCGFGRTDGKKVLSNS